jgi:hypothetical protein
MMMQWDPTIGPGTVINMLLFVGAIIAIFLRRNKDMEILKGAVHEHQKMIVENSKMIHRLNEMQFRLSESHAELKGLVHGQFKKS